MPCDRAPKSSMLREPPLCNQAGAAPTRCNGLACFGPTGVQEQGAGTRGSLGNLRDPSVSTDMSGSGTGIPTPRPTTLRRVAGSEQDARVVSPSEGNEARRDGRTGVGVPHSSDEAGEWALPDPVERRGCRVADRKPEPRRGHCTSQRVPATPKDRERDSESAA
jgi:hypothetical protein